MSEENYTAPPEGDPFDPPTSYLSADYSLAAEMYVKGFVVGVQHKGQPDVDAEVLANLFVGFMLMHQKYDDEQAATGACIYALCTALENADDEFLNFEVGR